VNCHTGKTGVAARGARGNGQQQRGVAGLQLPTPHAPRTQASVFTQTHLASQPFILSPPGSANVPPPLPQAGASTCWETFNRTAERCPFSKCLGRRATEADGSAGPFRFETYR